MPNSLLNKPLPQAIFFDLDGTLVDSVPDLAFAIDGMLADRGYQPVGVQKVRLWVGNGARKLVRRALLHVTGLTEAELDVDLWQAAHQGFLHHYALVASRHTCVYPHVIETLAYLQRAGVRMAVITNKPGQFTPQLLEVLGLADFFELVVCGDTLPVQKPDPAPLLHVMQCFGLEAGQCLMVGDSSNDISAANAAGVPSVCVLYGYNHGEDARLLPANAHIAGFEQLLDVLQGGECLPGA